MVTAMWLVAGSVVISTGIVLMRESQTLRRWSLISCGAAQLLLGMTAAAALTLGGWSDANLAWAADGRSVGGEEIFFQPTSPSRSTDAKTSGQTAISVEPGKAVIIPPGRPDWIAEYRALDRPYEADWTAVVAGPFSTRLECEKELSAEVKKATDDYINTYLGSKAAASLLNYEGADLKQRLVSSDDYYGETIHVSFGPMEQVHARVEFTDDFRRELTERWREIKAKFRLGQVGLIGAVVLGLLSTAFGFFKANTATRGTRGTSLQFAAAATILMIVVAGVSAARYLYWF